VERDGVLGPGDGFLGGGAAGILRRQPLVEGDEGPHAVLVTGECRAVVAVGRPLLLPNLMVHAEWALGALDGHGLDPKTMLDLHILLYSYIQGLAVNLEQEAQAEAATGLTEEQWMDRQAHAVQAIVTSARYPVFAKVVGAFQN